MAFTLSLLSDVRMMKRNMFMSITMYKRDCPPPPPRRVRPVQGGAACRRHGRSFISARPCRQPIRVIRQVDGGRMVLSSSVGAPLAEPAVDEATPQPPSTKRVRRRGGAAGNRKNHHNTRRRILSAHSAAAGRPANLSNGSTICALFVTSTVLRPGR